MVKKFELISEHIFEARHEASGAFLDIKGKLADEIKKSNLFPDWQIDTNTIKYFDSKATKKDTEAYASFNAIRFISYDPSTRNYFNDKTKKFIKTFKDMKLYILPNLTRVGIRTKCYARCELEFSSVYNKMFELFFRDNLDALIGKNRSDLQIVFDLKEDGFDIKLVLGSVHENEAQKYFGFVSDKFDNVGVYIDIDCYKSKDIDISKVGALVDNATTVTWRKIDKILEAIGI